MRSPCFPFSFGLELLRAFGLGCANGTDNLRDLKGRESCQCQVMPGLCAVQVPRPLLLNSVLLASQNTPLVSLQNSPGGAGGACEDSASERLAERGQATSAGSFYRLGKAAGGKEGTLT